jgi:Zn-dependent peptidase ImmA (M78 family)/transcriptional regulator with XRE-family HTH domain
MRNGTPGFQPNRLVEARDSRGINQVGLAALIGKASSSISRWEAGDQSPEPEVLDNLARALNLPVAFFIFPQPQHGEGPMFCRSMASATQLLRRKIRSRLRWTQDISLVIQQWLDLPVVNIPQLDAENWQDIRDTDIETMATVCRQRWNLGNGPISDVLLALENAGIIVVKEEVGSNNMDGVSNWSAVDERPYILIAADKATCVRSRLDAAHELGHLVLHRKIREGDLKDQSSFKEIERQAFLFAGAFLLPAESFGAEVWSPSLNSFLSLKERWRTSIGAMIKRCATLDILSPEYEQRLWKHYGSRGWRKGEPLDDKLRPEQPRLLMRSVQLLIEKNIRDRQALIEDLRFSASDIESLCGLPPGFMSSEEAAIISLPRLKSQENSPSNGISGGVVIPFNRR